MALAADDAGGVSADKAHLQQVNKGKVSEKWSHVQKKE
jgi:hypothetical protein